MALEVVEYAVYPVNTRGGFAPPQNANTSGFTTQAVNIEATSNASDAFGATTRMVRLTPDVDCYILFGAAPTAQTSDLLLKKNTQTYHAVTPGEKVAVITD